MIYNTLSYTYLLLNIIFHQQILREIIFFVYINFNHFYDLMKFVFASTIKNYR